MAGLFDASTTTMRQTATHVETETDNIRTDLQGLLDRLESLQGQWVGDGNAAFSTARTRYQEANGRLNQALVEIARLIKANEARYSTDDAQASTSLASAGAQFEVPGF